MAKVSTNLSIDADIKSEAQQLFADLGMDLSTAVNMFLRQAVREGGIPFTVSSNRSNTSSPSSREPDKERST